VSKAFLKSKKTAAMEKLLLKFRVTWSVILMHRIIILWHARKTNWHTFSKLFSSTCLWTILRITFTNSLPVVERRLSDHKFWGNFGSLPGFSKVIFWVLTWLW
jgi:hypothetical protein